MKLRIIKTTGDFFISDNYFITLNNKNSVEYTDKCITETLNIPYNDYATILKINNAYLINGEYYFEFEKDALKALEDLEILINP